MGSGDGRGGRNWPRGSGPLLSLLRHQGLGDPGQAHDLVFLLHLDPQEGAAVSQGHHTNGSGAREGVQDQGRHRLSAAGAAGPPAKLAIGSARDREKRLRENWGTPTGLLARWVRLHCLEMEVTAGRLILKARPQPKRSAPQSSPSGPSLFPDLDAP